MGIDLSGPSRHLEKAFDDIRPATFQLECLSLRSYGDNLRSTVFNVPGSICSHCLFPLQTTILERCHIIFSASFATVRTFSPGVALRDCFQVQYRRYRQYFPACIVLIAVSRLSTPPCMSGRANLANFFVPRLSLLHFDAIHGDSHVHNVFFSIALHCYSSDCIPRPPSPHLQFDTANTCSIMHTLARHFSAGEPTYP